MSRSALDGPWVRRAILIAAVAATFGLSVLAGGQEFSVGLPITHPVAASAH